MIEQMDIYDVAVIGAGMLGSAAARHLAKMGAKVALIGPGEPQEKSSHAGVFSSHYDQARVTRRLDSNHDWSQLTHASIDRYDDIAKAGQQPFFSEVGSIMAGPETGSGSNFIQNTLHVGMDRKIECAELRGEALRGGFPYFDFPDGILALYEVNGAGWINLSHHVAAQIEASKRLGAIVYRQEVLAVSEKRDHVVIECADETKILAEKVIVACGAFSKAEGLLPEPLPMKVYARTVTFFELSDIEVDPRETARNLRRRLTTCCS